MGIATLTNLCLPALILAQEASQHFFFPGLEANTGGLIREADYAARRAVFSPQAFWDALDLAPPEPEELRVSLFSYENAGLAAIIPASFRVPSPN